MWVCKVFVAGFIKKAPSMPCGFFKLYNSKCGIIKLSSFGWHCETCWQGMAATVPSLLGYNQTGTGTPHENDTGFPLYTLLRNRFASSGCVDRRRPESDTLDCSRRNQADKSRHCNPKNRCRLKRSQRKSKHSSNSGL